MVSRGIMARSQSGHGCSSLVRMPAHSPDISLAPPPSPPNYPPNESLAWPLFSSTAHILGPPRFAERILPTPPSPPLFLPTYFYLFSCESTEPRLALVPGSCCSIQMLIQKKKKSPDMMHDRPVFDPASKPDVRGPASPRWQRQRFDPKTSKWCSGDLEGERGFFCR